MRPVGRASVNYGANVPPQWLCLPVLARTDSTLYLVLRAFNPDRVDFWLTDSAGLVLAHDSLGTHLPYYTRPLAHEQPVFPFKPPPGQVCRVWVRLHNTVGSLHVGARLFSHSGFGAYTTRHRALVLGFLGFLLVVGLFALLQFGINRQKLYALYALYIFTVLLWQVVANGYGFWWVWPHWPQLAFFSKGLMLTLSMAALSVFIRNFLRGAPSQHRLLLPRALPYLLAAYAAVVAWGGGSIWLDYTPRGATMAGQVLWLGNLLVLLHDIVRSAWLRHRPAYYLVAAYSAIVLYGVLAYLRILKLLPEHELFFYAFLGYLR
jgi:hypothetical protein